MFEYSLFTLTFLVICLAAEGFSNPQLRVVSKPLASAGFLAAAWSVDPLDSPSGIALLIALLLSALGDVLLLRKGSKLHFLGGLGSFLAAHLAFALSFVLTGQVRWLLSVGLALLVGGIGVGVARWLLPSVPAKLKGPVIAYILVISLMVTLAWALPLGAGLAQLAATLFFLSDISVAIDRFRDGGFLNRLWGLPAYYAAQLLFVLWWANG